MFEQSKQAGSVRVWPCAEGLRPLEQTDPTKRTDAFLCVTAEDESKRQQARILRLHSLSDALPAKDPGHGRAEASPHPHSRAGQAPIHPATAAAAAAAASTAGSSHFPIPGALGFNLCSVPSKGTVPNTFQGRAWIFCVNCAQKGKRAALQRFIKWVRETEGERGERGRKERREGGRGELGQKDILSLHAE